MAGVIVPDAIFHYFLQPGISGWQRHAEALLDLVQQVSEVQGEPAILLRPSLDRTLFYIAEQDPGQSIEAMYEVLRDRGFEIRDDETVQRIWADNSEGWGKAEVIYAHEQQLPLLASMPATLQPIIAACHREYSIPLSEIFVWSVSELSSLLDQMTVVLSSSYRDEYENASLAVDSSCQLDLPQIAQSASPRQGPGPIAILNHLMPWLFSPLFPLLPLTRQRRFNLRDVQPHQNRASPQTPLLSDSPRPNQPGPEEPPAKSPEISQLDDEGGLTDWEIQDAQPGFDPVTGLTFFEQAAQVPLEEDITLNLDQAAFPEVRRDDLVIDRVFFVERAALIENVLQPPKEDQPAIEKSPEKPVASPDADGTPPMPENPALPAEPLPPEPTDPNGGGSIDPEQPSAPGNPSLPENPNLPENPPVQPLPDPPIVQPSDPPIGQPVDRHDPDPDDQPQQPGIDVRPDPLPGPDHSSPDDPSPDDPSPGDPSPGDPGAQPDPVIPDDGLDPDVPDPEQPRRVDAGSGKVVIEVRPDQGSIIIDNFGGVGRGTYPARSVIDQVDTVKLIGPGFDPKAMSLSQVGADLVIRFETLENTEIILTNFQLENLDNFLQPDASIDLANILFDGENSPQDRFDVFNREWNFDQVLNPNQVTFLNDLDNEISGFDHADDVINAQGGDDMLVGLGGNDLLRGNAGDDILIGGSGENRLVGDVGTDIFVVSPQGFSQVDDFDPAQDRIGLPIGLTLDQLQIQQGSGIYQNDTWILQNNNPLMLLKGVQAADLKADRFLPLPFDL